MEAKLESVTTIRTEMPLVSKTHKFGGTLDAIRVGTSLRLTDWKTSAGIYTEMLLQVAGGYSVSFGRRTIPMSRSTGLRS